MIADHKLTGLIETCEANIKELKVKLSDSPASYVSQLQWMEGYVLGFARGADLRGMANEKAIEDFQNLCAKEMSKISVDKSNGIQ